MTAQRSLSTPLCRQLGITHPIFGFSHSVDVTVAITLAGGFAVLGVARDDPEHIARALRQGGSAGGPVRPSPKPELAMAMIAAARARGSTHR